MATNKTIIIGLDGAPSDLITKMMAEGRLPEMAKLRRAGSGGVLRSIFPSLTCPAIPSFYTGVNPGELGVFDFRREDGSMGSFWDVKAKTIWDHLGGHGYKSLIFNVGFTSPAKPLNGIMVSDFNIRFAPRSYTYPENLKTELGGLDMTPAEFKEMSGHRLSDPERTLELLIGGLRRYKDAFIKLADKDDFDFLIFWSAEPDIAGHWIMHRPVLVERLYEEVDRVIGDLREQFAGYNFLVVSDHGFRGLQRYKFHINAWLAGQKFLVSGAPLITRFKLFFEAFKRGGGVVASLLLQFKNKFKRREKKDGPTAGESSDFKRFGYLAELGFREERSFAFLAPFYKWGIFLTERGMDKIEDIIAAMKSLKYRGVPVFEKVWKREEVFSGAHVSSAPEICFALSGDFAPDRRFGFDIFEPISDKENGGDHLYAPEGIFIAAGPDLAVLSGDDEISILDCMPLILKLFNIFPPPDLDGKLPEHLLRDLDEAERTIRP